MSLEFAELDFQQTPHGEISLRRRAEPRLDGKILYEVKLGDEFLMSSLFTEAEEQLSAIGLSTLAEDDLDIVVGGLGLGHTAWAALKFPNVRIVQVVEVMNCVIDWHQQHLVPLGESLTTDSRCHFLHADFFELATSATHGFFPDAPEKLAHALLLDIDHSPSHWLNPQNRRFYCQQGLQSVAEKLHSGGLFGMWSNDPPEQPFIDLLEQVFVHVNTEIVRFANPYNGGESSNTLYFAYTQ
jgi:predicted membrane-bound spermidine synthase